jgi:glycosyltransferase involved in cell wall biosynthesis
VPILDRSVIRGSSALANHYGAADLYRRLSFDDGRTLVTKCPFSAPTMMSTDRPLVSVIVPVYGVADYLSACVASLASQTYRNIEIILVNDGSPDSCGDICDKLAAADHRIRVVHKTNGGLSSARNAGLDIARGGVIGFVDGDDMAAPTLYESLVAIHRRECADIVKAGFCRFDSVSALRSENLTRRDDLACLEGAEPILSAFVDMRLNPAVWNKLYTREVIGQLRFPEAKTHEDEFFSPLVFARARRVAITSEILYYYRQRAGSIMHRFSPRARMDHIEARWSQLSLLQRHGVPVPTIDVFKRRMRSEIESQFAESRRVGDIIEIEVYQRRLQGEFRKLGASSFANRKEALAWILGYMNLALLLRLRERRLRAG